MLKAWSWHALYSGHWCKTSLRLQSITFEMYEERPVNIVSIHWRCARFWDNARGRGWRFSIVRGSGLNFSLRKLSSVQDYLSEQVWVLDKTQSAQNLGLSINVEGFTVLWGLFCVYESFIETERGYLVPAEPSGVRTGEEIKCRWTKQPSRSDTLLGVSLTSQC